MLTQTNELDDTETLDLLVGQLVRSESAVQTLGQVLAPILVDAMQHAQVSQMSQVTFGGHTRDQCSWVLSGECSLSPGPDSGDFTGGSNAGGTGLQPDYMNMNINTL